MRYLDVLNIVLVVITMYIIYVFIITPRPLEKFSTIYILNSSGYFGSYPKEIPYGFSYPFIISVINNEHEYVNYSVMFVKPEGSEIIKSFGLEHDTSTSFPYDMNVSWLWRENVSFSLIKNYVVSNLSLRLWINGSHFFVLNESGGMKIKSGVPIYFNMPLTLFLMNPFNTSKTFSLYSYYYWFNQNFTDAPVENLGTITLEPMEIKYVPYSFYVNKFDTNFITFKLETDNYTKLQTIPVEGDVFYMVNMTNGYFIPDSVPAGTELKVKLGLQYVWYTPGYRPLDFTFNHWKVEEGQTIRNATLLNQFNFTLEHSGFREFEMSQTIERGENQFMFELYTPPPHYAETIPLFVNGT